MESKVPSGQNNEFNEEFFGWEKTTAEDDRQLKFGDLDVFAAESDSLGSGGY